MRRFIIAKDYNFWKWISLSWILKLLDRHVSPPQSASNAPVGRIGGREIRQILPWDLWWRAMTWLPIVIVSYLIGSIPSGYIVARSQGVDIRQHGSRNIGATNVLRVMGTGAEFWLLFGFSALVGALAIWRHQTNIVRLLNGTESRFGKKWTRSQSSAPAGGERTATVIGATSEETGKQL
jgi:Glycerol-3-phosphate acyltransferase